MNYKFLKGTFLRSKLSNTTVKLNQDTNIIDERIWELWHPTVGEYRIYNFDLGFNIIPIFVMPFDDGYGNIVAINPINDDEIFLMSADKSFTADCEPFMNELPSVLVNDL